MWDDRDISPLQTEHARALRIPFLNDAHPYWEYLTGIVVAPDDDLWPGQLPTDAEVEAIATYLDGYRRRWYRSGFLAEMCAFAPCDIDGTANAGLFIKRAEHSGWSFRRKTWKVPPWHPGRLKAPIDLSTLLEWVGDRSN